MASVGVMGREGVKCHPPRPLLVSQPQTAVELKGYELAFPQCVTIALLILHSGAEP